MVVSAGCQGHEGSLELFRKDGRGKDRFEFDEVIRV